MQSACMHPELWSDMLGPDRWQTSSVRCFPSVQCWCWAPPSSQVVRPPGDLTPCRRGGVSDQRWTDGIMLPTAVLLPLRCSMKLEATRIRFTISRKSRIRAEFYNFLVILVVHQNLFFVIKTGGTVAVLWYYCGSTPQKVLRIFNRPVLTAKSAGTWSTAGKSLAGLTWHVQLSALGANSKDLCQGRFVPPYVPPGLRCLGR